jgi:tetratricopeptide (TPR) repeat protein
LALALLAATTPVLGHGDVHGRIAELDDEIAHHPEEAVLRVRRGSLHALDENWLQALSDYESAHRIDPSFPNLDFLRAKALLALEYHERAAALLDSFLSREPGHADAYLIRARANVALARLDRGIEDYSRAIALFEQPAPRYYVERARALIDAGRIDEALGSLREGVRDLGPLASIVEVAVAQEAERGRYEEALRWADQLPPALRHSPRWRMKAGDLADQAGEATRAGHEYRQGLAAIDALPSARQGTAAMMALRTELASRLGKGTASSAGQRGDSPGFGALERGLVLGAVLLAACLLLIVRWRARAR